MPACPIKNRLFAHGNAAYGLYRLIPAQYCNLIWSKKAFAVEVDEVVGRIGNPDLRLP